MRARPRGRARRRSQREVAEPLGLGLEEAAAAVLALATEKMVGAIEEITINQGIDPRAAVLVGGGGAAGLNAVAIARRLGCRRGRHPGGRRRAERRRRADVGPQRRVRARWRSRTSDRFDVDGGQRGAGEPRGSSAARSSPARRRARSSSASTSPSRRATRTRSGRSRCRCAVGRFARRGRPARAGRRASTRPTSRSSRSAIRSPRSSS